MIRIRVSAEGTKRALRLASERFRGEMGHAFDKSGEDFVTKMKVTRFRGYSGTKGDLLQNRSNLLRGSFGYETFGSPTTPLQLFVFSSGVRYAKLQELGSGYLPGGEIRPKPPRRYLTIPLRDNLTSAGLTRFPSAAALRDVKGSTFIVRTKKGKLLIGSKPRQFKGAHERVGVKNQRLANDGRTGKKRGEVRWLWLLVKSVKVPPRLGMRETFRSLAPRRAERMRAAIKTTLDQARSVRV